MWKENSQKLPLPLRTPGYAPAKMIPVASGKYTLFYEKNFHQKMSLKNPNSLKKVKKSLASSGWAEIIKNTDFFHFSYLIFSSVFIINGSTILFSKHGNIKRWKRWVMSVVCCYKQVFFIFFFNKIIEQK